MINTCCFKNKMETNIPDFLKDALSETTVEHLHFGDDSATTHSVHVPQNKPDMMEDNNSHSESSGSESDIHFERMNREEETKNYSVNNRNSLDEQNTEGGSMRCGLWDDDDTYENKHYEKCRENEVDIQAGVNKEQAEDLSALKMVLPKGTHYDLETMSPESTSGLLSYQMVDKPEKSSTSKEDRMELSSTEEHVLQHAQDDNKLNCFSATKSTLRDWPEASMEDQCRGELKEFTEEDHENNEREEEGLAEYPSDLSQSDSGDSSEGYEGGQPNHMDIKLAEVQDVDLGFSNEMNNLEEPQLNYEVVTSRDDNVQRKDERMDPADMLAYVKSDNLNVETPEKSDDDILFQTKQDSFRGDEYSSQISITGESSDFGISKFQSTSNESYMKEQCDYDSDSSSDDDDNCKSQGGNPDFTSHTISEHNFKKNSATNWNSIEHEIVDVVVTDSQKEVRDVEDFSNIPASPEAGMEGFSETNISVSESHPLEAISVKPDKNDREHNREHSEVSDISENINNLLPGTFWALDDHNLKLDEYDWDINGEEVICDEEDDFQNELENDEVEMERDWEKEKLRIEAFNRFYQPAEGEETKDRIHKVTFCLDLESSIYELDSDSSEEELSTKACISELHPPESTSVKKEQSNKEDSHEPSEVSYIENISTFLTNEEMKLEEYDHDLNVEELYQINSSKAIYDDEDDFLERLKNEIERDMEQEKAKTDGYCYKDTDRTHRGMSRLDQGSSQNEEDNDSSEQETNSEEDTANVKTTEDQSDSDEPHERRLYAGRHKPFPKGFQKTDKQLKEHPKRNKCLVLLRSVLAVSLTTVVGLLSYYWATDNLDWIY